MYNTLYLVLYLDHMYNTLYLVLHLFPPPKTVLPGKKLKLCWAAFYSISIAVST